MIDLGKYAFFVWASYGAVFAVLGGLAAWIILDERRQQKMLADFDGEQEKS